LIDGIPKLFVFEAVKRLSESQQYEQKIEFPIQKSNNMRFKCLEESEVFSTPDLYSPSIMRVFPGDEVELGKVVYCGAVEWVEVTLRSGQRGFIDGKKKVIALNGKGKRTLLKVIGGILVVAFMVFVISNLVNGFKGANSERQSKTKQSLIPDNLSNTDKRALQIFFQAEAIISCDQDLKNWALRKALEDHRDFKPLNQALRQWLNVLALKTGYNGDSQIERASKMLDDLSVQ
jgi:hypothetical protein